MTKNEGKSKKMSRVPFLGPIFLIANAYVSFGKAKHFSYVAPSNKWFKRLGKGLISSFLISIVIMTIVHLSEIGIDKFKPEEIVLSLFPNLLGFGIGVFALLFALPNDFLNNLIEANERLKDDAIGPEMLPADMAYPLAIYCLSILITVACIIFPDSFWSTLIILTILLYGIYVTLGLLTSIFSTASYMLAIRKKAFLDQKKEIKRKKHSRFSRSLIKRK